jgi:hypothetical protein
VPRFAFPTRTEIWWGDTDSAAHEERESDGVASSENGAAAVNASRRGSARTVRSDRRDEQLEKQHPWGLHLTAALEGRSELSADFS